MGSFRPHGRARVACALDAGRTLQLTSGRSGIALALRHLGIARGDEVLVPAYHCTSMIEPVVWSGGAPVFYRIRRDTAVDLDDVQQRITPRTRALLVVHYFGFPQNLVALRAFCDHHRLALIEDCAHALFGEYADRPLGSYGDYAITSSMKFFPIYDGGHLVSAYRDIQRIDLESGSLAFEAKAAINAIEYALEYDRLGALKYMLASVLWVKNKIWDRLKANDPEKGHRAHGPSAADGDYAFDPGWLMKRMSVWSRLLMATVARSRITAKRRDHYMALLDALSALPGCEPLFPELPRGVVPYVFPLLVDEPERVFPVLKRQGVPILRFGEYLWEGVDELVCPVTADLSRRLFQFPCHQELRREELAWMIDRVKGALAPGEEQSSLSRRRSAAR